MSLVTDVQAIRDEQIRMAEIVETQAKITARQEEQINGERGLSKAIDKLSRAVYWVGGLIVAGSITMAFSALSLH